MRVGSTNRRADAELIGELRRFARGEGFDEQPMSGLDSEAIDFRAASESLETLGPVPTVGGMILFGKDRERHFPDSWIQAGRFRGTNKSHILEEVRHQTTNPSFAPSSRKVASVETPSIRNASR
jgi:predicted HTH transcriptional regulator